MGMGGTSGKGGITWKQTRVVLGTMLRDSLNFFHELYLIRIKVKYRHHPGSYTFVWGNETKLWILCISTLQIN